MAEIIVATLNVSFDSTADSSGASKVLKLEIDDREDGLNSGKTSFTPGSDAGYFLFKDEGVSLVEHIATSGGITSKGTGVKEIDENISFSNSDSGSLGYPPNGSVTMKWLGRSFVINGTSISQNSDLPEVNGSTLSMRGKNVAGVLNCVYESTGSLFLLKSVPEDIPESMIIAIGSY